MRILLIIPAFNEEQNIVRVAEHLQNEYPQYDFIVVNDGSMDRTASLCAEHGYPLLDLPVNLGLAGAFQAGLQYAKKKGYDCALQFDGDGQHRPEYIDVMVEELKKGADIVIGSRFLEKKKGFSMRMIGSRLITTAIRITTGHKITDPTSGMRLFGKSMIDLLATEINYGPEPDTISFLIKKGARVKEIQVEMDERQAGTSYLSLLKSVDYMVRMNISILLIQNFRK